MTDDSEYTYIKVYTSTNSYHKGYVRAEDIEEFFYNLRENTWFKLYRYHPVEDEDIIQQCGQKSRYVRSSSVEVLE